MCEPDIKSVEFLRDLILDYDAVENPTCIAVAWAADEIERLRDLIERAQRLLNNTTWDAPEDLADLALIEAEDTGGRE